MSEARTGMGYFSGYFAASHAEQQHEQLNTMITTGIVVDTNDPMEIGRVRVCCPAWGDDPDPANMNVNNLPWARVMSPFGGFVNQGFRANGTEIEGETSYGMHSSTKVGAEAVVTLINGDRATRLVTGFVRDDGSANTLPHGRYKVNGSAIEGPFTVDDKPIEPLFSNAKAAFTNAQFADGNPHGSFEWVSRGADFSAGAHGAETSRSIQTSHDDDGVERTEADGRTYKTTQGSSTNRMGDKKEISGERDASNDPSTHCWVSPGFHAMSMDDRMGNTRMKFRSSTGHQILLDDTNERIYVSTNQGNCWFEMDSSGNMDVYSGLRLNIFSAKDMNLTTAEDFRVSAKNIHMKASNEFRLTATADIGVHSNANIRMGAGASYYAQAGADIHLNNGAILYVTSGGAHNYSAGAGYFVSAEGAINVTSNASIFHTSTGTQENQSGGNIINTAPMINNNNGQGAASAAPAAVAQLAAEQPAKHTTRIPQHEPWPRMMMDSTRANMVDEETKPATDPSKWTSAPIKFDGSDPAEFEFKSYNDPNIGRIEGGVMIARNKLWHR